MVREFRGVLLERTPQEVGACAMQIVGGWNISRPNGLEELRRSGETTGPQSPSAYRVAFPAAAATERRTACKLRHKISWRARRETRASASPIRTRVRWRVKIALPLMHGGYREMIAGNA